MTATSNRIDLVERRLPGAPSAAIPGLARELRDLELESGKQLGQQARKNDVRIRTLRRELAGMKVRPAGDRAGPGERYPQRTRIITPGIPEVDLEAEWLALQKESAPAGD